jgi:hypothetical protein
MRVVLEQANPLADPQRRLRLPLRALSRVVRRHQERVAVIITNRDSMTADRGSPLQVAGRHWTRRKAVMSLGALAGSIALAGRATRPAWAEPPPETTRVRLVKASLCTAPAYVAEELLRAEGFSEVRYVDDDPGEIGTSKLVATGEADLNMSFGLTTLVRVDAGEPVLLAWEFTRAATNSSGPSAFARSRNCAGLGLLSLA